MKLSLCFCISAFLILSCSSNKKTQANIRLDLAHNLINEILSDTTDEYLGDKKYCLSEMQLIMPLLNLNQYEFYEDLFNENDTNNIYQQLDLRRGFVIDTLKVKKMKILTKDVILNENFTDTFWKYVYENCSGGYITFTQPVFSKNNSLVYINLGYMYCRLCGAGEHRLYKRENGKWIFIKSLGRWVS